MPFQRKKPAAIGIKANFPGLIEPALATSIEKVPSGERAVKRPRDIAERARELRDIRRVNPDGFLRETFTLPVKEARAKARALLRDHPAAGYMTTVERWRQLPDGRIEFTMRRLPTAD